jgi:Putative prokaryotic signal transducing protein
LLAARGVRARIFNANASSLAGELPIEASLPQVWVEKPDDAPRARALIEEFVRSTSSGPSIICPKCGEENPPSFDLCWSCGTGLEK